MQHFIIDTVPTRILLDLSGLFEFFHVSLHNSALGFSLRCCVTIWAPWGLIRTHSPYMDCPTLHSCTDLSVYCYLLNILLIATLLLPCYKPALLFFFFHSFHAVFYFSVDLWITPILSHSMLFAVLGFIQILLSGLPLCFGLTWVTLRTSVDKRNTIYPTCLLFHCTAKRTFSAPWYLGKSVFHLHCQKIFIGFAFIGINR